MRRVKSFVTTRHATRDILELRRAPPEPGCGESLEDEYDNFKSETYQMLFGYIRSDVLTNEKIVRFTDMTQLYLS